MIGKRVIVLATVSVAVVAGVGLAVNALANGQKEYKSGIVWPEPPIPGRRV